MARTGFGSRFLLGQRNSGLAGRALITTFVLAIAVVFCGGAMVACSNGLREVLDPRSALYRLRLPSGAAQAGWVFRFSAPLRATSGDRPAICEVHHEHYVSGKNGGWRLDGTWTRSAGAIFEGQPSGLRALDRSPLRIRVNEPVALDPSDLRVVPAEQEAWFRTVLADVPTGGRLRPLRRQRRDRLRRGLPPTPTAHTSPAAAAPPPSPPATAPRGLASTRTPASSQAASRPEPPRSSSRWPTSGT
ncbi:MAG: hypothetical protein IPN17_37240 [Deltaproteobacteria bacterium]|nr:hypothetical protein [Deltaproteobacteria bacterium]